MSDGISDAYKQSREQIYEDLVNIESGKCSRLCKEIKQYKWDNQKGTLGMTKKEYFEFHKACLDKMEKITAAKNADYTGIGDDPFANFTRVEAVGICSTEQGFLTRMMDKLSRINSFVQKGELQVKDESVEDTLLDLANYAILFAGYIRSKK